MKRVVYLLMLAVLLLQCHTAEKLVAPTRLITYPADGATVFNTVQVKLHGAGPKTLLLRGQTIATLAADAQVAEWNTRTLDDGTYSLHLTGPQCGSDSVRVTVRNNLITTSVPAGHLGAGQRGFLFASDEKGNVLSSAEMQNDKPLILPSSEFFEGNTFSLSEAYVTGTRTLQITTVQQVPRGEWTLQQGTASAAVLGSVEVGLTLDPAVQSVYYASTLGDYHYLYTDYNQADFNLTTSPSRLFLREVGLDVNHYVIKDHVEAGQQYRFTPADVNQVLQQEVVTLEKNASARVVLYGFPDPAFPERQYELGRFFSQDGALLLEYPGTVFPAYGSFTRLLNDRYRLESMNHTQRIDLTPLRADVQLRTSGEGQVMLATSGDFALYELEWSYVNAKLGLYADWLVIGAAGRSEIVERPFLPAAVTQAANDLNLSLLTHSNSVLIGRYDVARTYEEFLRRASGYGLTGLYPPGRQWKEQVNFQSISTGRLSTSPQVTLHEHLTR